MPEGLNKNVENKEVKSDKLSIKELYDIVAHNVFFPDRLEKFLKDLKGEEKYEMVSLIIDAGGSATILDNPTFCEGLDINKIALKGILREGGYQFVEIFRNKNIKDLGLNDDIAQILLKENEANIGVAKLLERGIYKDLSQETALKLIEGGYGDDVAKNLKSFKELNEKTLDLINKKEVTN